MNPLVTCLCLTKNRREWLPQAIECFKLQTYEPKELLIVVDGQDVSDLIPINDETIRLVNSPEGRFTIGEKRNFGNKHANGEIIVHWDDDDWSAPQRLADQVARLVESGKSVTGYSTVIFAGDNGRWKYIGVPNCTAVGTSLCYLKSWWSEHPFPDKHVSEDNDFAMTAAQNKQLISCDAGEMVIASIHPGNTSPRHVEGQQWRKL